MIPNKFGLGIIDPAPPSTPSIKLVILDLSYVLSATVGNLIVEPPPAVSADNADSNAAAAPGLNAPEIAFPTASPTASVSPPIKLSLTDPNDPIAPNPDSPYATNPPTSVPENADAPRLDKESVTPPIPSAI